ncbi:MAG: hypothetical protein Q7V01_10070 [Vicinamibacterales bacterium]|nr:hypothetical protein [Vicinamibacterales bacterium]
MFEFLALGVLLVGGLLVIGLIGTILKLLLKLIFLPFLLLGFVLKLALGLLLLPVIAVAGVVGAVGLVVAGLFALVLPLLPIVLAGLVVVALVKWLSRPAAVPHTSHESL